MEKYDAIIKCINDTLKDKESSLNYYREEMPKRDARIRELENKVGYLELALCDETQKNNELISEVERLKAYNDALNEGNAALRDEIKKLQKRIDNLTTM